jgi:hypothetical protein
MTAEELDAVALCLGSGPNYNDILPFSIAQMGIDFVVDLVVDPTIDTFALGCRIYGDNLPARFFLAIFKVNKVE